jgi:sulfite exporter TauE/SafE
MLIRSAGAESVWDGVGMMAAFGLGIVPALAATGFLASYAGSKVRSWGERIASLMLILMGLSLIWRGVMAGGSHH